MSPELRIRGSLFDFPKAFDKITFHLIFKRLLTTSLTAVHNHLSISSIFKVDLQKSLREADQKNSLIETSRRVLEEQERELEDYRQELVAQEAHNHALRQSMEFIRDDAHLAR